ncbi:MAG: IS1 family transposase [Chloroflexi bacterium]|nr:MAG: IS1 family transposase [Chloroflexota bacterium]
MGRVVHICRQEKNEIYLLTVVDRDTRCVLSWDVVPERTSEALQACLERAPQAKQYYSDAFPVYDTLYYGAPYEMRTDKQETYSVEAVNADLRHYLKRLARKSRCFSRRMQALAKNIQLFVYCYNHRQTFNFLSIVTIIDSWQTDFSRSILPAWLTSFVLYLRYSRGWKNLNPQNTCVIIPALSTKEMRAQSAWDGHKRP